MMPSIEQSLVSNLNLSGLREGSPIPPAANNIEVTSRINPFLRCPVPPIGTVSPDDLQQFDRAGSIPQFRVIRGA